MNNTLRVTAWDDARCVEPLKAAAKMWWQKKRIELKIQTRPLTAFNDQPLTELAETCDVMVIDHPHVSGAAQEGAILPLDSLLDENTLARLEEDALANCYKSYFVGGHPYAVAADAACHVSAYRPDVLALLNVDRPKTWDEIFSLAEEHPGSVAVALHHTDAISCLFSLLAGQGTAPTGGDRMFLDRAATIQALELLAKLAAMVPDICWQFTPPQLFAEANKGHTIAYIPFTFGYTRLTQPHEGNWRFGAPPVGAGSLLGGAGIAVSSRSTQPEEAATFAAWYVMPDVQTFLTMNGAQPGSQMVWNTPLANKAVGYFFSDTLKTMEQAYTRPLAPWWPPIQKECGQILVAGLQGNDSPEAIITKMERCYAQHRTLAQEVTA